MFKRCLFLVIFCILFLGAVLPVSAKEKLKIYFFYGNGCPHCAREEIFLDKLAQKYEGAIEIYRYEVWDNKQNAQFLAQMAKELNLNVVGVPITIIGSQAIVGYDSEQSRGEEIESIIRDALGKREATKLPGKVKVPFLGEMLIKNLSLPALAITLGAIDGFNPCAMWVLVFLIGLLLSMKDRKRMGILGGAFLVASAIFYFFVLSAWLSLFLFLDYIKWIKILIGAAGITAGGYQIREYWINREGVCKVTRGEERRRTFDKIKKIVESKKLWLALIGIIILAFSINLIELVCSLGLPVVFTQMLALAYLPAWQYYFYILLYIFFFMLDDMLIFAIALATFKIKVLSSQYSRYSTLIGGIIMLVIGLLLILKPAWIMFG